MIENPDTILGKNKTPYNIFSKQIFFPFSLDLWNIFSIDILQYYSPLTTEKFFFKNEPLIS